MSWTGNSHAFRKMYHMVEEAGVVCVDPSGIRYVKYYGCLPQTEEVSFDVTYEKTDTLQSNSCDSMDADRLWALFTLTDIDHVFVIEILELFETIELFEQYLDEHFERQEMYVLK